MQELQNILMITNTQSIISLSMKEQLMAADFRVLTARAETDEINKCKEDLTAVLVFTDETMTENLQAFVFLKDRVMDQDVPVFVVGNLEETDPIEEVLTKRVISQIFQRPIDVKEVVKEISEYIKKNSSVHKKKILVVDDSGAMLRNVKGWLEHRYQVILANSGAMAIKSLALNKPDLVLLDYEMPVVDGKQVLEMIRSEAEFADIPVIFLTSKGDKESVMKVMALKPEGYLLKTMKPDQIVQTIDEFFVKQKAK